LSVGILIELAGDDTGGGELGLGRISGLSFVSARGFVAGSGGGDFSLRTGGGDFDLI
jgi:hypothetical protein